MNTRLVPTIYAYSVCLVSIITFMFALPLGVNSLFNYLNPITTDGAPKVLSKSFSIWKEDYVMRLTDTHIVAEGGEYTAKNVLKLPVPSDSVLQATYQAQQSNELRMFQNQLLAPVLHQAALSILSFAIFFFHWRWLKSTKSAGTA